MVLNNLFGFLGKNLAMDLGTANTLIYTLKDGIVLNEPSVVALDSRSNSIVAVGREAREFLGRTPEKIKATRPLKDGVIADFEVTKTMIAYFIKKVIQGLQIVKPKIVICVPTGITQVEKRAVIESALQAGSREVRLIEEPVAAALGAKLPIEKPLGNMVVDIGGGTTEVAVISLSSVSYAESVRIAGDEMDTAIQRFVKNEYNMLIGEVAAENIKMNLSSVDKNSDNNKISVTGKNIVNGTPHNIQINTQQIKSSIQEPINAIVTAVRQALEKTPPELVTDIANNGLLLTGGGALLPGLDQLIKQESETNVFVDEEPLTTVLRGTGEAMKKEKYYKNVFIN